MFDMWNRMFNLLLTHCASTHRHLNPRKAGGSLSCCPAPPSSGPSILPGIQEALNHERMRKGQKEGRKKKKGWKERRKKRGRKSLGGADRFLASVNTDPRLAPYRQRPLQGLVGGGKLVHFVLVVRVPLEEGPHGLHLRPQVHPLLLQPLQ